MSKWTLTRKTQAAPKSGLHNLREGCFKMKLDDRKTEGATRFGFRKRTIKSTIPFEHERQSHDSGDRPDVHARKPQAKPSVLIPLQLDSPRGWGPGGIYIYIDPRIGGGYFY